MKYVCKHQNDVIDVVLLFLLLILTLFHTFDVSNVEFEQGNVSGHRRRPTILSKKKTLAQVLSCAFCKNFKNTCFTEHLDPDFVFPNK